MAGKGRKQDLAEGEVSLQHSLIRSLSQASETGMTLQSSSVESEGLKISLYPHIEYSWVQIVPGRSCELGQEPFLAEAIPIGY